MASRSPFPRETNYRNNVCVRYLGKARDENALFYIRAFIVVFANNNVILKMKRKKDVTSSIFLRENDIILVKDVRNLDYIYSVYSCLCFARVDIENWHDITSDHYLTIYLFSS